jgi:hypothetical protein
LFRPIFFKKDVLHVLVSKINFGENSAKFPEFGNFADGRNFWNTKINNPDQADNNKLDQVSDSNMLRLV